MNILFWGKGHIFNCLMEYALWKKGCEITGIIESKKDRDYFEYGGNTISVYEPNEIQSLQYDFIVISNVYLSECLMTAEENGVTFDKIIIPYANYMLKKEDNVNRCHKCMENAEEIITLLNKWYNLTDKRVLLYGDDTFLWQFLSVPQHKNAEIIGVVSTTHSIQGHIKICKKDTKVYDEWEIQDLDFDMIVIMDRNAPAIFSELSQKVDKNKIAIPFMTGIEKNPYEIIIKLEPYFNMVSWLVDTLSILYSAGRQPQHMAYDMFTHSLFNCAEYKKLGFSFIGDHDGNDYGRIRTLELLIDEIKGKKLNGALAELGVFTGEYSKVLNYYFPQKELYLYDTFEGFDERDISDDLRSGKFTQEFADIFTQTSLEAVQKFVGVKENIHYRKGYFPESIAEEEKEKKFCLVSLDADLYNPTLEGLKFFYPRLESGGYIMIHEYNAIVMVEGKAQDFSGVKRAVKDFENQFGSIRYVPIADRNGTLVITK